MLAAVAALAAFALIAVLTRGLIATQVARPLRMLAERIMHIRDFGARPGEPMRGAREIGAVGDGVDGLAQTVADLSNQAATDALTGVANRRAFDSALSLELARARRHDSVLALVIFDFDGFGEINDRLGHAVGDDLLRQVAEKLGGQMRATDLVARVGGDEFAMILPEMRPERAREVADRARTAAIITLDGKEISLCAGIACYPAHAEDPKALFECADGALYLAKGEGEGRTEVYDPTRVTTTAHAG